MPLAVRHSPESDVRLAAAVCTPRTFARVGHFFPNVCHALPTARPATIDRHRDCAVVAWHTCCIEFRPSTFAATVVYGVTGNTHDGFFARSRTTCAIVTTIAPDATRQHADRSETPSHLTLPVHPARPVDLRIVPSSEEVKC